MGLSPRLVRILMGCGVGAIEAVGVGEVDDSCTVVFFAFGFDLDGREVEAEFVAND